MAAEELQGTGVWDTKQEYETVTAFRAFQEFYLHQPPPRNVNKAFRLYYFEKNGRNHRTGVATRFFRQWADAKDSRGRPIEGALTWTQRAAAYDEYKARVQIKRDAERRDEAQREYFGLIEQLTGKLKEAVNKYKPTGDESLSELTLAAKRIYEIAMFVYGLNPKTFENEFDDDGDNLGADNVIIRDILAEMAEIAEKAGKVRDKKNGQSLQ